MSRLALLLVATVLTAATCDRAPGPAVAEPLPAPATPADQPDDARLLEETAPKPAHAAADRARPRRTAALPDRGIWPDLDDRVWLQPPPAVDPARTSVVVDKARRVLTLLADGEPLVSYPIALGSDSHGDKRRRGDGRTPEGGYYICEMLDTDLAPRYGARSLRLSFPNAKDAARGAAAGLISDGQRRAIERAIASGGLPPQDTALGSSIRIHGGGVAGDWTAGCVALRDEDVIDLYGLVRLGTEVRVLGHGESPPFGDRDGDGIPDRIDVLLGARKTVLNGAEYDGKYVRIPPRGGDVPRAIGVCTDVIVRALRNAGLDLQVAVQEDRNRRPKAYPRIDEPNPSIDHRRVKNLAPWLERNWSALPAADFDDYLPGDVVLMDTLPAAGPDHIGIVSDRLGESGRPLVVNNWTVGHTTAEMDLLDWVEVTHRYRWPNL